MPRRMAHHLSYCVSELGLELRHQSTPGKTSCVSAPLIPQPAGEEPTDVSEDPSLGSTGILPAGSQGAENIELL